MKRLLALTIGTVLFLAASAHAALIEVSGRSDWSCGTGTGGFEPGCSPDVETGVFSFTYDADAVDEDPAILRAVYSNIIRSFTMTVEQESRPDLLFTLASPVNSLRSGVSQSGETYVTFSVTLAESNNVVGTSAFTFNTYRNGVPIVPSVLPTPDNYWPRNIIGFVGSGAGVTETDWLHPGSITSRVIPEPAAPLLLAAGLLALISVRRRRTTTPANLL
jgi:hypothetical protein